MSGEGSVRLVAAWAAAVLTVAIAPQQAAAAPKPDLKLAEISTGSTSVEAGSELSIDDTTENVGAAAAGRSTTRFYASTDNSKGGGDARLQGKRSVGRLGKDKDSSGESQLSVPLIAPQGDVFVIGCADDRKQVEEKRENNNCRATGTTVSIELPTDCTDRLTALGISYETGPIEEGVDDPVTVETPINGITYSSLQGNDPELYMDCTLALALHDMADEMTAHGLDHVEHFGIYNYRCIGGEIPNPGCPNGFSQHAYAKALDIGELRSSTGETYNVNDDWVIDSEAEDTCTAATSSPEDQLLHEFVCALHTAGTFHIVLTPNYNEAHRNHFHLDLTPDASFID